MPNKVERFTNRARLCLSFSEAEAKRLKHSWIGTEHLLVGLIQAEGVAGQTLQAAGLKVQQIQVVIEQVMPVGKHLLDEIDLTTDFKKLLELAVDEARLNGDRYVGTEHLLLALLRQTNTPGSKVLDRLQIHRQQMRQDFIQLLRENPGIPSVMATNQVKSTESEPIGIYIRIDRKDMEAHGVYYETHPTRYSQLRALFRKNNPADTTPS